VVKVGKYKICNLPVVAPILCCRGLHTTLILMPAAPSDDCNLTEQHSLIRFLTTEGISG
jgi:hypothetical protein